MHRFFSAIFLFGLVVFSSGCTTSVYQVEKWEYKRLVIDPLDNKNLFQIAREGLTAEQLLDKYHQNLNELGEQGWELVSTSADTKVHFFKRRL